MTDKTNFVHDSAQKLHKYLIAVIDSFNVKLIKYTDIKIFHSSGNFVCLHNSEKKYLFIQKWLGFI